MNARDNKWSIVIEQHDNLNKKDIDVSDIINCFSIDNGFDFYCGILHDKDLDDEGVLKTPHYHIYVDLHNSYAKKSVINAIAKYLRCNVNIISCKLVKNVKQCVRYLTHTDDLKKYQYDNSLVFTNDIWKYENYFDYGNGCDVDVEYIYDLCKRADSMTYVYSTLGLNISNKYRNIIRDIYIDTHGRKD